MTLTITAVAPSTQPDTEILDGVRNAAQLIRSALDQWDETMSEADLARVIWLCRRLSDVLDRMDERRPICRSVAQI